MIPVNERFQWFFNTFEAAQGRLTLERRHLAGQWNISIDSESKVCHLSSAHKCDEMPALQ
jgi:hypothetical protein